MMDQIYESAIPEFLSQIGKVLGKYVGVNVYFQNKLNLACCLQILNLIKI
jgi:hypothetical protein